MSRRIVASTGLRTWGEITFGVTVPMMRQGAAQDSLAWTTKFVGTVSYLVICCGGLYFTAFVASWCDRATPRVELGGVTVTVDGLVTYAVILPALYLAGFAGLSLLEGGKGGIRRVHGAGPVLAWLFFGVHVLVLALFTAMTADWPEARIHSLNYVLRGSMWLPRSFCVAGFIYCTYSVAARIRASQNPNYTHSSMRHFLAGAIPTAMLAAMAMAIS
ncbi:hypothetical protein [Pengzhenrongella phosphoraccumulans]|uniref:hypothetical protein n=1 Tax=Pengzhenrongella phosphoraccumulans TaxID=3114394 RepID=UPI00388F5BCF